MRTDLKYCTELLGVQTLLTEVCRGVTVFHLRLSKVKVGDTVFHFSAVQFQVQVGRGRAIR
jgi:hypothetical protein